MCPLPEVYALIKVMAAVKKLIIKVRNEGVIPEK